MSPGKMCIKCGTYNFNNEKFCEKCGTELNESNSKQLSYAGFKKRVIASIIDSIVLGFGGTIILFPLMMILMAYEKSNSGELATENFIEKYQLIIRAVGSVIWIFYFVLMETSKDRGTIGKIVMEIAVIDTELKKLTIFKSFMRNFCKMFSSAILCFGFLMAAFTEKKQALHDKMTKCIVINKK